MNIGVDIRSLMDSEPTGVGEYTYNLLKKLFEIDSSNQYYLFYNSSKKVTVPKFDVQNVHYCKFNWPNKLLNLSLIFFKWPKIDKLMEKKYQAKPDLFFLPNINFIQLNCPYIITCHDLSFKLFSEFLSWKRKLWHWIIKPEQLYKKAVKTIAISRNTKNDLVKMFGVAESKVAVIYSGINDIFFQNFKYDPRLEQIKTKYQLPINFILYLGTLEPRKNIETIIDAFNLYHQTNQTDLNLVIVGKKGWLFKKILKKINQSPFQRKIVITDFVSDEEKPILYHLAKAFVFPSYYEGFGFPPVESIAQGCPVITAHNSSLTEICGRMAVLVDPYNVNDLSLAIHQVATNQSELKSLDIKEKFNWEKSANKFLALLENLEKSVEIDNNED